MTELSIKAASEPAPPDDEFGYPRRMRLTERLRFIAIFIAAVLLSIFAAIVLLPFALVALLKQIFSNRTP
jgi:hypothetical protein